MHTAVAYMPSWLMLRRASCSVGASPSAVGGNVTYATGGPLLLRCSVASCERPMRMLCRVREGMCGCALMAASLAAKRPARCVAALHSGPSFFRAPCAKLGGTVSADARYEMAVRGAKTAGIASGHASADGGTGGSSRSSRGVNTRRINRAGLLSSSRWTRAVLHRSVPKCKGSGNGIVFVGVDGDADE